MPPCVFGLQQPSQKQPRLAVMSHGTFSTSPQVAPPHGLALTVLVQPALGEVDGEGAPAGGEAVTAGGGKGLAEGGGEATTAGGGGEGLAEGGGRGPSLHVNVTVPPLAQTAPASAGQRAVDSMKDW